MGVIAAEAVGGCVRACVGEGGGGGSGAPR